MSNEEKDLPPAAPNAAPSFDPGEKLREDFPTAAQTPEPRRVLDSEPVLEPAAGSPPESEVLPAAEPTEPRAPQEAQAAVQAQQGSPAPEQSPQAGQPQQRQPGEQRHGRRRRRGRGGRAGSGQAQGQGQAGQPQGQPQGQQGQPQGQAGQHGQHGQHGQQRQRGQHQEQRQNPQQPHRGDKRRGEGHRDGHRERERRSGEGHSEQHQHEQRHREGAHAQPRAPKKPVKREILAQTSFEETRVAIIEDGRLAELMWERRSEESIVGNIYKGVVENVLPGISSAFVNIGFEKNAYLYISDVLGERGAAIDATLKKGQHIMVQVAKEAISTKGMKVTMDISLPGRFLVFTPFQEYVGISKHIEDPEERKRLSAIVDKLVAEVLGGKGVVVRTEAEGATAEELEREVRYLHQSWEAVQKKFQSANPPALLHKDLDVTLQVARDILSDQVYVYLIDNKQVHQSVVEFVEGISPELKEKVRLYDAKTPIFKAFNLEQEIENIRKIKVSLPNGGSIVIQEAESLCAIDVNTGRFTGSKSQEETVTQTNIEAAQEIAHQLRLRNIGGIIVVDFIDMRKASNRNKVMEAFAQATRDDRAKIRILPITRLGLIEMTRERKRQSTGSLITDECPECKGAGRVLSSETIRIRIQREIHEMTGGRPGGQVRLLLHPQLAEAFRQHQSHIEKNVQRSVKIQSDPQLPWEDYRIVLE